MSKRTASVDLVADQYVDRAVALDPLLATYTGITGHDDEMPDLSADGFAARAELDRSTLAALEAAEAPGLREQVARAAMQERLGLAVECYDAGDTTSQLNVIASRVQDVREVFDVMPTEGEQAAVNVARRMAAVPAAYSQLSGTLLSAARGGRPPARLQVEEVAKQCAAWAKTGESFYAGLVEQLTGVPDSLRGDLERGTEQASAATAELGAFLTRELLPLARQKDACGREVYSRALRYFLGAAMDLEEVYARGWEEIARIRAEQERLASLIQPGATRQEAVAILDSDPARRIQGRQNFRAWMQELADRAISDLHGVHFDVPAQARRIEAMIAPTSDGGIYYSRPSEDWSRPGRVWWSVPDGQESFATWKEVTTIYHEGVPGHHLQISQKLAERENLNRWQRLLCWVSGHGEGWAVWPGSSCRRIPTSRRSGCALNCIASWAGPVRPRPTCWARRSGCRPGRKPETGPKMPSASRISTPGHSAWAPWAWTRCARHWPGSNSVNVASSISKSWSGSRPMDA